MNIFYRTPFWMFCFWLATLDTRKRLRRFLAGRASGPAPYTHLRYSLFRGADSGDCGGV